MIMFARRVFYLSVLLVYYVHVFFGKLKLKETCLPYLAEGFEKEIRRNNGKSYQMTHFLKTNTYK